MNTVVAAFDRFFFGPVAAARPWLLAKAFLLLLAFDCWVDLSPHGGRYGIGGFNVAHFAWLDALVPAPSPAVYVGLIVFCGLLALGSAIGGFNRAALALLCAVYTYAWSMSMLDSYQHHYLLTIVLLAFVFYPLVDATHLLSPAPKSPESPESPAAAKKSKRRGKRKKTGSHPAKAVSAPTTTLPGGGLSAWAYHTTAISFGIVYSYTALSKSEPQWRDGTALSRIAPEGMQPFHDHFVNQWGLTSEDFWSLAGGSVILVQLVIAAGYFCAPLLDRKDMPWARWVCGAAFFGATSFHLGAEYLDLQIGWFSYYMLIGAAVILLPTTAVGVAGRLCAFPARAVVRTLTEGEQSALPMAIGVAVVTAGAGYAVDMPGALSASIAAGVALVALAGLASAGRVVGRVEPFVLGTAVAALCMWVAFVGSEARYDYYRFVGGDHRRRGEMEEALEAYIKANDYAPDDDNRREREDEVRRALGMPARWSGQ